VTSQREKAQLFLELHHGESPLLMPNPWDAGSAKLLASLGFAALATTSSGHAASLGRADGAVTRDEALAHAADLVAAVDVPVSADLEKCYADDPAGVAETVRLAAGTGLAGCSIEDWSGDALYDKGLATERVAAAAEAAAASGLVLTGRPDLADTIGRLQAFQAAGADVLYAPALTDIEDIRQVVGSLDKPVNVLAFAGGPTVPELAAAGVSRVSVGGAFAFAALGAVAEAARELQEKGTYGYLSRTGEGASAFRAAVSS
jgi:2-methylisocitrate lyase-like PEP mutase family enzyme